MLNNVPKIDGRVSYSHYFRQKKIYCDRATDLRNALKAITEAENWILSRLPVGIPLVILMGEHHDIPSHPALQQAVLAAHITARDTANSLRFAAGFEYNHDTYLKSPNAATWTDSFRWLTFRKPAPDPDGKKALRTTIDFNHWEELDDSYKSPLRFCRENKISVSFNDLSRTKLENINEHILDQTDSYTSDIIKKHAPAFQFHPKLHSRSRIGMALRNIGIVDRAIDHIKRTKSRIYIQQCGKSHIFGLQNDSTLHSLNELFQAHGCAVLPVFINTKDDNEERISFNADTTGTVFINRLSERKKFKTTEDEKAFWKKINQDSGSALLLQPALP